MITTKITENPDAGLLPNLPRNVIFQPKGFEFLGWIFVDDDTLREAGYNPETFSIVKIGGLHYELQAYIKLADCWWIELVDPAARETIGWTPDGSSSSEKSPLISEEVVPVPEASDSLTFAGFPMPSSASTLRDSLSGVTGFLKQLRTPKP